MGTTANYQIPYPELTDPPDGAGQMKALANKIDALLYGDHDSGWINLTVAFQANWQANASVPIRGRRLGPLAMLNLNAQRITTTLVSDAAGNFTDTKIFTCADARFQPDNPTWFSWTFGAYGAHGLLNTSDPSAGSFSWLLQSISAASTTVAINQLSQGTVIYPCSASY